jgi:hypothetical protein
LKGIFEGFNEHVSPRLLAFAAGLRYLQKRALPRIPPFNRLAVKTEKTFGPWHLEITPEDGARVSRLAYKGYDLLTVAPQKFRAPGPGYGPYESRPVYGYDDCFPSVVPCRYPESEWDVPDHGEVCWLPWECGELSNGVRSSVRSRVLPLVLTRTMIFEGSRLIWDFGVENHGGVPLPAQHVMHPLVDPGKISEIRLPGFRRVYDYAAKDYLDLHGSEAVEDLLLGLPSGGTAMLFLRDVDEGEVEWKYHNGLSVLCTFPIDLFPTLGIWWDNAGHPDLPELARSECAFEPTPGSTGSLAASFEEGGCLEAPPGSVLRWRVVWEVSL